MHIETLRHTHTKEPMILVKLSYLPGVCREMWLRLRLADAVRLRDHLSAEIAATEQAIVARKEPEPC